MRRALRLKKLLPVLPPETAGALAEGEELAVVRRQLTCKIEQLHPGERAVVQYISTRDVDRDGDILVPTGARLDEFMLAPQVLWAHDYSQPPIARAESIEVDDYGIRAKTVFADTDRARELWELVQGGFLSTASVGFIPLETVRRGEAHWREDSAALADRWGVDVDGSGADRIIKKWQLLEYSLVPVPANINALVTAVAKGLKLSDDMQTLLGVEVNPKVNSEPDAKGRIVAPVTIRAPRIVVQVKSPEVEERRLITDALDQIRGKA